MPLINFIKKLNGNIKSISLITHERLHFVSFSFANDSMLLECKLGAVKEQIKEKLQYISGWWNKAVAATRRIILAMKSYTQVVQYTSKPKNWWHPKHNKNKVNFIMKQEGTRKQINILNLEETDKLLRTKLCCDGEGYCHKSLHQR